MNEYEKQGLDFLESTGTKMDVVFLRLDKHWPEDKHDRDIYSITLSRNSRSFTFDFGQSIACSGRFWRYGKYERGMSNGVGKSHFKPTPFDEWHRNKDRAAPTAYCILSALTKNDPGTFENFCGEYGCETDSRKAEKTYKAVVHEYTQLCTLYSGAEMEKMAEIS